MKKKILALVIISICATTLVANCSNLSIESNKQTFSAGENKAKFEGNVKVKLDDITVTSPYAEAELDKDTQELKDATFFQKPYAFQNKPNKKSEIKANILKVSLLNKIITAKGDAQTIITTEKKPTVIITAETQTYNTNTNIMTAEQNVIIDYDDIKTYSNRAVAYVNKDSDLKKIELHGNAKITKGKDVLQAQKFTYTTASEIATSQGQTYTDLTSDNGKNIKVWANYQQYDKKKNIIMASGNVKVEYESYTAIGPKATVYPDKTKKLNEVIFTGRSKIIEQGRSIEADRIKMYLNPQNFFAEGNVKTMINNVQSLDENGGN